MPDLETAVRPAERLDPIPGTVTRPSGSGRGTAAKLAAPEAECTKPHVMPVGAESVPGKRGVWRVYVEDESDPPF